MRSAAFKKQGLLELISAFPRPNGTYTIERRSIN